MIFVNSRGGRTTESKDGCWKTLMTLDDEICESIIEGIADPERNRERTQAEYFKDIEKELYPYEKCEELLDLIACNYKERAQDIYKVLNLTLANIVKNDTDETKRKLKTNNKFVIENIMNVSEAYEFVKLIGFEECIMYNDTDKVDENVLYLKNPNIDFFNYLINSLSRRRQ